jgi:hypothetical protein
MPKQMNGRTNKAPGKKIHRVAGAVTTGGRVAHNGTSVAATSRRVVAGRLEAAERRPRVVVQGASHAPAHATNGRAFPQTRMDGSAPTHEGWRLKIAPMGLRATKSAFAD